MASTRQEIIEELKQLLEQDVVAIKDQVDHLKTRFYSIEEALEETAAEAEAAAENNPVEEEFKALLAQYKAKRAEVAAAQAKEEADNLARKQAILDEMRTMVEGANADGVMANLQKMRELQSTWKTIGAVPAPKTQEIRKAYQQYQEQFYDLVKINIELRDLDFKKNLEQKTLLCEAAERLQENNNIVEASRALQQLHDEWAEIGPVARELREDLWNRFKAASTVINKKHQQYFDERKAQEEENLTRKTALCEKIEAVVKEDNKNSNDWDKHTKAIMELQAEWKTIGFAPQKMNVKIFERFRKACDEFFKNKAEYFRNRKEEYKNNADKKRALIEKAKALQDSTDWKSTSDKFINLQKEWKTIGTVPKKMGDQMWQEFNGICNKFFEAANAAGAGTRSAEHQNLNKKREIVEQLKALTEQAGDDLQAKVQKLVAEYQAVGHVPYKEKDKIYEEYHAILDKLYKTLNISSAKRRLNNFKDNLKQVAGRGENALDNERARLMRQYEQLKNEVQTYENNLGFLNASSKKGNSLIDEMNRKVQKLKDQVQLVREKIKAIDSNKQQ